MSSSFSRFGREIAIDVETATPAINQIHELEGHQAVKTLDRADTAAPLEKFARTRCKHGAERGELPLGARLDACGGCTSPDCPIVSVELAKSVRFALIDRFHQRR